VTAVTESHYSLHICFFSPSFLSIRFSPFSLVLSLPPYLQCSRAPPQTKAVVKASTYHFPSRLSIFLRLPRHNRPSTAQAVPTPLPSDFNNIGPLRWDKHDVHIPLRQFLYISFTLLTLFETNSGPSLHHLPCKWRILPFSMIVHPPFFIRVRYFRTTGR